MYALKSSESSKTTTRTGTESGLKSGPQTRSDILSRLVPGSVQFKLALGSSGDAYESEADHMADRVVTGQPTGPVSTLPSGGLSRAQRQETGPDQEEETVQAKGVESQVPQEKEKEKPIQRKEAGLDGASVQAKSAGKQGPDLETASKALSQAGTGQPLEADKRSQLEGSFGVGLQDVRIHQDNAAQASARALNARAFTRGKDIFMGAGESPDNTRLIAHEVTHVLQQKAVPKEAPKSAPENKSGAIQSTKTEQAQTPTGSAAPTGTVPATTAEKKVQKPEQKDSGKKAVDKKEKAGTKGDPKTAPTETGADAAGGAEKARAARVATEKKQLQIVRKKTTESATQQQGAAASPVSARKASQGTASSASAASPSPANEAEAMGKGTQVETMGKQEAGKVDKKTFAELVKQKLREMEMPKNPQEMADFKKENRAAGLKGQIQGEVGKQKSQAAGAISTATKEVPKPAEARKPQPLQELEAAPKAAPLAAAKAAPKPMASEETSLEGNRQEVEGELARENLTEDRMLKANDPRFSSANESRKEVDEHATTGPQKYRQEEKKQLSKDKTSLQNTETQGSQDMMGQRGGNDKKIIASQKAQMSKEEAARIKITRDLDNIYLATQKVVQKKLDSMDGAVDSMFTLAEIKARNAFEKHMDKELEKWKDKRYAGLSGKWTWIEDRFRDINELPDVIKIYEKGQDVYFDILDQGIDDISTYVDTTLSWCKQQIVLGVQEVKNYIKNLGEDVKKLVGDAADEVMGKFEDLKSSVDEKKDALVDKVVQRYQESREKLNARIEAIKDANRSLVVKAKRKIKAVLDAIEGFRKRLMSLLAEARSVVEQIIDDPIGFLKNLLKAVKKGFQMFKANILKHLKTGVFGWLFGTFASRGIEIPPDFGFANVVKFLFALMGITYESLRKKAVKLVGERNVAIIEQVFEWLKILFLEGPMGIWNKIKEEAGNFKEMIIEGIKDWIMTKIVTSAVTKLVSMFNPVGAIVQAVMAIYSVIMFFVERIEQIMQLVQTIVRSLGAIVAGKIDAAAQKVEQVMALMLPLIISFLARLLNLGGIADRVMKIIKKVQRKVDQAIDKMLKKVVAKLKGFLKKGKTVYAKGKKAVKKAAGKLMGWLKFKKKPKFGGETHTLFFKGKDKNAQLTIQSTPMVIDDFLHNLKNGKIKDTKNKVIKIAKADADKLARWSKEIEKIKSRDQFTKKDQKDIASRLTKINNLLGTLGAEKHPPSKAVFTTHTGIKGDDVLGKNMKATLSLDPGNLRGSQPSGKSKLWKAVNGKRKDTYVRGHLLNHHVHGPGVNKNLTPITRSLNALMETRVEDKVKNMVLNQRKVVSYEVDIKYGNRPATTYIPEEKGLCTSITFLVHEMENKGTAASPNWVEAKETKIPSLKHEPPVDEDPKSGPVLMRLNMLAWQGKVNENLVRTAFYGIQGVGKVREDLLLGLHKNTSGSDTKIVKLDSGKVQPGLKYSSWKELSKFHTEYTREDGTKVRRELLPQSIWLKIKDHKDANGRRFIFLEGETKKKG